MIAGLGLPHLDSDYGYEAMIAGTGTYIFDRANEILTGARLKKCFC